MRSIPLAPSFFCLFLAFPMGAASRLNGIEVFSAGTATFSAPFLPDRAASMMTAMYKGGSDFLVRVAFTLRYPGSPVAGVCLSTPPKQFSDPQGTAHTLP